MNENISMRKWELFCIVFNALTYKMFMGYPQNFIRYGGSAAWLTALLSGAVFLVVLGFILKIFSKVFTDGILEYSKKHFGKTVCGIIVTITIIYFIFEISYTLYSVSYTLKSISYKNSPLTFIIIFLLFGAVVPSLFGDKAVRRLHSLNVLAIGISLAAISVLSLRRADMFNIYPILGNGIPSVLTGGISSLFIYSDIILIFFLPKNQKEDASYSFGKTVFSAALLGVAVNVICIFAINLNMPYEISEKLSLPMYPLCKTTNLGKFPLRLDAVYQIALIASSLLYTSMAFCTIFKSAKSLTPPSKKSLVIILCLILCLPLCGCYDGYEVEDKAYIIAVGTDKGISNKYRYTFQISNPLKSGESIGELNTRKESSIEIEETSNKTVDNITIEADSLSGAKDKLKNCLGKYPDMSHIKVIVFSYDVAYDGIPPENREMLYEREFYPNTNLCLAISAEDFLLSVKPTLEESTVRYYELYFKNFHTPYAPVTKLRDFTDRSIAMGFDGVIPIMCDSQLSGMGVFHNSILKDLFDANDVLIYKMLLGELPKSAFGNGTIQSNHKPKISVSVSHNTPKITINLNIKTTDLDPDATDELKKNTEAFLERTSDLNCDILGFGRYAKRSCLTQKQWENTNWDKIYPNSIFYLNIFTNNVNNTQNLQK